MGQVIRMRAVLIEPDASGGEAKVIEVGEGADSDLNAILGGWLETVPTRFPHTTAIVNEDGYRLGLPLNSRATEAALGGTIVGRMVLLGAPTPTGDLTPVPDFVVDELRDTGAIRTDEAEALDRRPLLARVNDRKANRESAYDRRERERSA